MSACVATRLTPQGRGAVAVILVEGESGVDYVSRHFVPASGRPLTSFSLNRIIFGRWEQADGNGEEIVVCRTGEKSSEVNCHGGVAAARAIMSALVADGAVEQSKEDWGANCGGDSIEAEAWLALMEARTERAAAILLDQYRGALRQEVEAALNELNHGDTNAVSVRLAMLLRRADVGRHLTTPWRIAFAGPPNVGKSSLMNCLLGYQRSIVFDEPGTTRDLLSAPTAFDGWSVELTDTAGLRDSTDAIEVEGVSRATSFLGEADLTVLVFDVTDDTGVERDPLLRQHPDALLVMNKCDLVDARATDAPFFATSALTGAGITELIQQIVRRLVQCELGTGDAVPFTLRQVQAIDEARNAIDDRRLDSAIESMNRLLAAS
ncbi:MAG: GTP-binding protein [Planctomycetes bacterium]|nr:GTP-binding protein [Planctomycetota bacterium]